MKVLLSILGLVMLTGCATITQPVAELNSETTTEDLGGDFCLVSVGTVYNAEGISGNVITSLEKVVGHHDEEGACVPKPNEAGGLQRFGQFHSESGDMRAVGTVEVVRTVREVLTAGIIAGAGCDNCSTTLIAAGGSGGDAASLAQNQNENTSTNTLGATVMSGGVGPCGDHPCGGSPGS